MPKRPKKSLGDFYLSTDVNQLFTYTGGGDGHLHLVTRGRIRGTQLGNSSLTAEDAPRAILDFDSEFFQWIGGSFTNGTVRNDGQINLLSAEEKVLDGRLVNRGAMLHHDDGVLLLAGTNALINDTTGVYTFTGDGDWGRAPIGGGKSAINRGLLAKSGSAGEFTIDVQFNNSGVVRVHTGTLTFDQFNNTGSLFVHSGATLGATQTADVTVPIGAAIGGAGTFDVPDLSVAGTLAPGDSIGILTVLGDLHVADGAIYAWEVGADGADLIDVLGELTFGSTATLDVIQLGAAPTLGEYNLFHFTGDAPVLPDWTLHLPHGWDHNGVIVDDQFVKLTITAVPEPTALVTLVALGAPMLLRRRR